MEDRCCAGLLDSAVPMTCVGCRTAGKPVDSLTVKALLTESALSRFEPAAYSFCPDSRCNITYFAKSSPAFSTADLRVAVWQKVPPGRRTICYCFGENEFDITSEIDRSGTSLAVERIRAHISAGRCACEVRNPRGACCLGDVAAAVDRIREERLGDTPKP